MMAQTSLPGQLCVNVRVSGWYQAHVEISIVYQQCQLWASDKEVWVHVLPGATLLHDIDTSMLEVPGKSACQV
jgi:hypothetical protein